MLHIMVRNDRSKYLILGRCILICACRNTFSYALMPFLLKIIPIFLKILIKDFKNCQHQLRVSNNSFEEISLLCNYYCNICYGLNLEKINLYVYQHFL